MIKVTYADGFYRVEGEAADIAEFIGEDQSNWTPAETPAGVFVHGEPIDLQGASLLARAIIGKLMQFKLQPDASVVAHYSLLRSKEGMDLYEKPALRNDFAKWFSSGDAADMPISVRMILDGMKVSLHPEQVEGLSYWYKHRGRAILAWVMGAGKTLAGSIIAYAVHESFKHTRLDGVLTRVLVICPPNMAEHWARSLIAWGMTGVTNPTGKTLTGGHDAVIVTYSRLDRMEWHKAALQPGNPLKIARLVIVDECQHLKNHESQAHVMAAQIIDRCASRVLGSGTPALNRPIEWFPQLRLVRPDLFNDRHKFALRYCNAKKTAFGWDYKGNSRLDELHETLSATCVHFIERVPGMPAMHRHPLVIADMHDLVLPTKLADITASWEDPDDFTPLETQRAAITKMVKEIIVAAQQYHNVVSDELETFVPLNGVERTAMTAGMQKVETLFQLLARIKLPFVMQHLRERLKARAQFIVATHYESSAKELYAMLNLQCNAELITGATSMPKREEIVQAARDGDVDALVVTTQSVGVGVDGLQDAFKEGYVVDAEVVPGLMRQLEARIWRQGQKETVQWFYFLIRHSIDEAKLRMLFQKLAILSSVTGGAVDAEKADENASIMGDLLALFVGSDEVKQAAKQKQLQQVAKLTTDIQRRPGNRGSSKADIMADMAKMSAELAGLQLVEDPQMAPNSMTIGKTVMAEAFSSNATPEVIKELEERLDNV